MFIDDDLLANMRPVVENAVGFALSWDMIIAEMANIENPMFPAAPADDPKDTADEWRVPFALRVIAFIYILFGVTGVTEMIIQLLLSRGVFIDLFSLLAIFTGRGLMRWRNGWRLWAVFCSWLFLTASAFGGAMSFSDLLFKTSFEIHADYFGLRGGPWFVLPVSIAYMVFSAWQIRVLWRPDIVRRFRMTQSERLTANGGLDSIKKYHGFRFSIASLLLGTLMVAFVLMQLLTSDAIYDTHYLSMTIGNQDSQSSVEYGVRHNRLFSSPDELLYVVISHENPWSNHVKETASSQAQLKLPDGRTIALPSKCQLYEIVAGQLKVHEIRVTLAEFYDFIESSLPYWSLDALINHAEDMRAKQKK